MKSTLFLVNIVLTTKVKKLQEEISDLKDKIQKYETQGYSGNIKFNPELGKRKRKRKTKDQVERNFKCNIGECKKSYGSENSLNQHMKLKHPEFWAKMKEKEQILTHSTKTEQLGIEDENVNSSSSQIMNVKEELKKEELKVEETGEVTKPIQVEEGTGGISKVKEETKLKTE